MNEQLLRRLAELILTHEPFTAVDLTAAGSIAIDGSHAPNAKQNGIGSLFNTASRRGWIRSTGGLTNSTSPHRKGGAIRTWIGTVRGEVWADEYLES